jgi:hypothetical protein
MEAFPALMLVPNRSKEIQMYFGGGILGTILVVALIVFLVRTVNLCIVAMENIGA